MGGRPAWFEILSLRFHRSWLPRGLRWGLPLCRGLCTFCPLCWGLCQGLCSSGIQRCLHSRSRPSTLRAPRVMFVPLCDHIPLSCPALFTPSAWFQGQLPTGPMVPSQGAWTFCRPSVPNWILCLIPDNSEAFEWADAFIVNPKHCSVV